MAPLSERVSGMIAKGMVNLPAQGTVLPLERCQLEVWQSCGPLNGGQNMRPPRGPQNYIGERSVIQGRREKKMGPGEGGESISQKRNALVLQC